MTSNPSPSKTLTEEFRRTVDQNPFIPIIPTRRQQLFLTYSAREVLYGGAAGGGKSCALLAAALQYVETPGYNALLLRRTFSDLYLADALIPMSHEWLSGKAAKWDGQKHKWTFPSGAVLQFGYLEIENDKYRYQGSAWSFVGFDELTQFTETQYQYLFSRTRKREELNVPLRNRSASNPGGVGHEWVKKRFIDADNRAAGNRVFVSARLEDNQYLAQQEYDRSLQELDPVTRAQLRTGDWDVCADGVFKREWFRYYKRDGDFYRLMTGNSDRLVTVDDCSRFAICDIAGTEKTPAGGSDPDYTVVQIWDLTPTYDLILVDQWRGRCETPDVEDKIVQFTRKHDCGEVWVEKNGIGLGVMQTVRRRGVPVRALKAKGSKLQRSQTVQCRMEGHTVFFPHSAPWLDAMELELLQFTGDGKLHDDQADCLSYSGVIAQKRGGAVRVSDDDEWSVEKEKEIEKRELVTAKAERESQQRTAAMDDDFGWTELN